MAPNQSHKADRDDHVCGRGYRTSPGVGYASSPALDGRSPILPHRECSGKKPLSASGADKFGCELHARLGGKVHGISSVEARLFNVYGTRQDANSTFTGTVSIFLRANRAWRPHQSL